MNRPPFTPSKLPPLDEERRRVFDGREIEAVRDVAVEIAGSDRDGGGPRARAVTR